MAHAAPVRAKIPTKSPQAAHAGAARPARPKAGSRVLAGGAGRPATRGNGNPVIELECGITVYPARDGRGRWRAVWYENGKRRQCEGTTEARLAVKLEKVVERLTAGAPNMEAPGADLIAFYLSPDRLPADHYQRPVGPAGRISAETRPVHSAAGGGLRAVPTDGRPERRDCQRVVSQRSARRPGKGITESSHHV